MNAVPESSTATSHCSACCRCTPDVLQSPAVPVTFLRSQLLLLSPWSTEDCEKND